MQRTSDRLPAHWINWITLGVILGSPLWVFTNIALGNSWGEAIWVSLLITGIWCMGHVIFWLFRLWRHFLLVSLLGLFLMTSGCALLLVPAALGVGVGAGLEADAVIDAMKKGETPPDDPSAVTTAGRKTP